MTPLRVHSVHSSAGEGLTESLSLEVKAMEDGSKYDSPEPRDETRSKAVGFAVLGILVVLIMILIATGTVQVFDA